jgi:glucosamine-6-phosphate deaminase
MEVIIQPSAEEASAVAARLVAKKVREKPGTVLGLATGSTPLRLYRELIRMHREESLDFRRVATFNLDEYVGLPPDHPQSYSAVMQDNLFSSLNIPKKNIHIPDGLAKNIPKFCEAYEKKIKEAGGIDLQVLGIGSDGHIAFNEPTSSLTSRTRIKTLTDQTIEDNARFFGDVEAVPRHVITMGVGTIMEASTCLVLAFGSGKADAIAQCVEGPVTSMVPASALQLHPVVKLFLDPGAASKLTRADYYQWVYEHKPDWQRF